ncbi:carbohydrate esterase family 4 protein [Jaapia argillacea MUCL 33604]|uniref:chitin deacetylase n=1 Tax=Jaapia argillacea MUCL 33604 TaxID=933084 RepID=A0A067PLT8_9AGAM|nr:carbohydrate esterase family 4 protein [Jaapia argillacea MUCL 33604]
MKLTASLVTAAALPIFVSAHAAHNHQARDAPHRVRQVSAAGSSSASASGTPAAASGASVASGSSVATTATPLATASYSLMSTNPTAIPLSQIISGAPAQPTHPLDTTYAAGSIPSAVTGGPALPNPSALVISSYPALDKQPATDSPQVLQWIQDVQKSGVAIPNIAPTVAGGCAANAAAVADTSRCWWTCGGCTRNTDITTCPDPLTWGLTYDDGPSLYTPDLIDYLDSVNIKSTFFVVGSRALSYPATLQAEYMGGHQIAVHTWSHPSLTTLTNEQIIAELGWSKKIIKDVLGVTPNMMRPPYGDIDDRVRAISIAMGLTPVMWTRIAPYATFDTNDFNIAGGLVSPSQVLANWEAILGNATTMNHGFIVLEHDLFQQSVDIATGYILPDAQAHKFKIEPVISCLNLPMSDAYVETNNNKTNPPLISGSGAVTLSSGAPGSAQATGGAGNNNANGTSHSSAVGLVAGSSGFFPVVTAIIGLMGLGAFLV